jgi:undecaprenyl-diphosphatase
MTLVERLRLPRLARLLRDELWLVLALALIAGGILLFLRIADLVVDDEADAFDRAVFLAFRVVGNPAETIGPAWLPGVVRDITAFGGVAALSLIVVFTAIYLLLVGKRGAAGLVLASIISGTVLSQGLKWWFDRARPDLVPGIVLPTDASFPSGHAMLSAVAYLTLGALLTRVEAHRGARFFFIAVAVVMTVLIGVSRVYLGVHWPTDVLGGWCLGAAWALLCWIVALWLQRRGAVEGPRD